MEVNKSDIQKWVEALRSGKYSQTKKTRQDQNGYCCLGVACKVFIPENEQKLSHFIDGKSYLNGGVPYDQPAPIWLKEINDDFCIKTEVELSVLNDGGNPFESNPQPFSFEEIADLLEAVYIHEALA